MTEEISTQILFSLSSINNFYQTTNLPAPFICNAFRIICSTPVFLETNIGNVNPLYTIDDLGNIDYQLISGIASNCDKEGLVQLSSTSSLSALSLKLLQPSPINNKNVYDIILKLYYI